MFMWHLSHNVKRFIVILQSGTVLDLLKDFTALYVISSIDNMIFTLARRGFLGSSLLFKATRAEDIEILPVEIDTNNRTRCCNGNIIKTIILNSMLVMSLGFWAFFKSNQRYGVYFYRTYPYCNIEDDEVIKFGDGICDGGLLNSIECDFDGGDCINFNIAYPNCETLEPTRIGDGTCDEVYNNEDCKYDGADCCPFGDPARLDELEDGNQLKNQDQCDGGQYSTTKW